MTQQSAPGPLRPSVEKATHTDGQRALASALYGKFIVTASDDYRIYSYRRATSGSTFAARRAGNQQAIRATSISSEPSDICVTCTPSNQFFVKQEFVRPGAFVAAVGADSENKQELEPTLLSQNTVVVDILDQCASIGELHHALDLGLMSREDVHAELSEIVAGRKPSRTSSDEIIIFDSIGMALQDVIAAATVYEKAVATVAGRFVNFNEQAG